MTKDNSFKIIVCKWQLANASLFTQFLFSKMHKSLPPFARIMSVHFVSLRAEKTNTKFKNFKHKQKESHSSNSAMKNFFRVKLLLDWFEPESILVNFMKLWLFLSVRLQGPARFQLSRGPVWQICVACDHRRTDRPRYTTLPGFSSFHSALTRT